MIEVEKKFSLTEQEIARLTQEAIFLGEKTLIDVYYDTPNYNLTKNDIWLRQRNGGFEIKMPLNNGRGASKRTLDQYQELETEDEIRKVLNLTPEKTLVEDLQAAGFVSFATLVTTRKKYQKEEFNIDIDQIDFGYSIVEVELMVPDQSATAEAEREIMLLAKEQGWDTRLIRGKAIEYLYRYRPDHYQALVNAGVV